MPPGPRRHALAQTTAWLTPRPAAAPITNGLAIAGEFSRASGLGEGARLMARAAEALGIPVWRIDIPDPVPRPGRQPPHIQEPPPGVPPEAPLVLHVNAPMLPLALLRLPRRIRANRRIIGYWAWELMDIPAAWHPALPCVNHIWTPSGFTATALEPLKPGQITAVPPALGLLPPRPSLLDRQAFGLPAGAVITLVPFSLASSMARKNPLAAIAAFRMAFGESPDHLLIVKAANAGDAPDDLRRIANWSQAANIRLETRVLSARDNHALTACADIVLSLHRAEGFGLCLAEAMLLGKPVIATGWSGNLEYMDASNAIPLPYRLIPARDPRGVYQGQWAEPDLHAAVQALRALADSPGQRARLGASAQQSLSAQLGAEPLRTALLALR
jgi:glycosyltransferase involved in cell wall biosynthesis